MFKLGGSNLDYPGGSLGVVGPLVRLFIGYSPPLPLFSLGDFLKYVRVG